MKIIGKYSYYPNATHTLDIIEMFLKKYSTKNSCKNKM